MKRPEVIILKLVIAVKRHYDLSNSYKGKHLIGNAFQGQRFISLLSWWEARRHTGSHGAGQGAGNYISISARQQEEGGHWV